MAVDVNRITTFNLDFVNDAATFRSIEKLREADVAFDDENPQHGNVEVKGSKLMSRSAFDQQYKADPADASIC